MRFLLKTVSRLPAIDTRRALPVLLLAATLATPAYADETGPVGGQSAAPTKSSATGISEEARGHFAAGVALLQDPEGEKVEEAYREFRAAYDISGSPKVLGNMGFCAMRLERDGEAIDAYSRYLREVSAIDPEERAQIVRDLQTLTVGVSRITIQTDKPGVRLIDVRIPVRGERLTNTYGPVENKLEIGVRPGHHIFTAKLDGHDDAVWELDVFAGSRETHTFAMHERVVATAASGEARSPNLGPWIMMGIGGAMLVGGAVTGIVALGKTNDLEQRCPNDVCPRTLDLESERSSAKTWVRVTDVLLIGGGVVTAGGLGWLIFGGSGNSKAPEKTTARHTMPIPRAGCGPDGCRASVEVKF